MDPMRHYGNIKENVSREDFARRKYEKKWGFLSAQDFYKLYNQTYLQKQISENGFEEPCPYQYTGEGDSYFLSKDMYNSLLAKCRCDRSKSNLHIVKCLQKVQNQFLDDSLPMLLKIREGDSKNANNARKYPETTAGEIGWIPHRYREWEWSTHYDSPKNNMPGYKIDSHPYSNIFIG